jgi:hypothetical protein
MELYAADERRMSADCVGLGRMSASTSAFALWAGCLMIMMMSKYISLSLWKARLDVALLGFALFVFGFLAHSVWLGHGATDGLSSRV